MPISQAPEFLRETHLVSRRCRERMLDSEHQPMLRNAPFRWVGYSVLRAPYRMVRLKSVHSHLLACVEGRGRAFIDGKMVEWRPGQVMLGPVGVPHAFEIAGPRPWTLAWVFFDDDREAPVLTGRQAELRNVDSGDFVGAVQMLTREATGVAQASMLEPLVSVLDIAARRLAGVEAGDPRLKRLWGKVETTLAHDWTISELAKGACMSEEHLRRLCHKYCQRSPGEQLTQLRLRRASTLLRSSSVRLEDIAEQTGYSSVYSFSAAFRRWSGTPPARFRRGG